MNTVWDTALLTGKAVVATWLPKAVRSCVRLGLTFQQTFLFLSCSAFNLFFPKAVLGELKGLPQLTLFDSQNKEQSGILIMRTKETRWLGLPKVKVWRDSVLGIDEDLMPNQQLRENHARDVWAHM